MYKVIEKYDIISLIDSDQQYLTIEQYNIHVVCGVDTEQDRRPD